MTSAEIRNSFLKFFEERGHTIISSSPVVPYDDPTLLFANAGMNQFKDVFLGNGKRSYKRAANTQKCIRVSGKHNDLEEVGRDTYHHTFFEMLGNWSFGDYYKKEAIAWAWELLTKVWGLPKNRLWATVYKDDQEAEQLWKTVTDIDPSHVLRFGEKDNFWEMGETGPCGPCSEIHIDRTLDGTATAEMVNAGIPEVMEIWNLVFIQYNRDETGKLTPLPARHVDTGMGFERVCAVLQNEKSNYNTDLFTPIIESIEVLADKKYSRTLPSDPRSVWTDIDTAIRVIADHTRMLSFAIADGAVPSNEGRGYVLKQVLNRAARFGRILNFHEPFIYKIVDAVVKTMGDAYPELVQKQTIIKHIIQTEEERFSKTEMNNLGLDYFYRNIVGEPIRKVLIQNGTIDRNWRVDDLKSNGNTIIFLSPTIYSPNEVKLTISEELKRLNIVSITGEDTFKLYTTYGLQTETTQSLAKDIGLSVDIEKFNELMEKQKESSRGIGRPNDDISNRELIHFSEATRKDEIKSFEVDDLENKSTFCGYDTLEIETQVLRTQENMVVLAKTPFFGESGGQIGDRGKIFIQNKIIEIIDTQRKGNINIHFLRTLATDLKEDTCIKAQVDKERRLSIQRNHSATHLLHNALRRILGTHVHQAGSLVAPDYLRFDFAHFAKLSDQELADIESLVNEKIKENIPRTPGLNNIPFEEANKLGALMFFGDKYGDFVNVIQFGDFSIEFCGGTHVNNTGEIGYFKICEESSVASGTRRIVAVTGTYALDYLIKQKQEFEAGYNFAFNQLEEIFKSQIKDIKELPPIPNQASPELASYFTQLHKNKIILQKVIEQDNEEKKKREKEIAKSRLKSLSGSMDELIASAVTIGDIKLVAAKVSAASIDELKNLGDSLRSKLGSGVGLLACVIEDKVQLVCVVTDDLVAAKIIEAGKVVGSIAKIVGGGGGGRAHMATAGGKDVSKLDEALAQTKSVVESFLRK